MSKLQIPLYKGGRERDNILKSTTLTLLMLCWPHQIHCVENIMILNKFNLTFILYFENTYV